MRLSENTLVEARVEFGIFKTGRGEEKKIEIFPSHYDKKCLR